MAITVVNPQRGTATEKVSDQTLTLNPNANLAAGNWGLLAVVIDNTGAGEGETNDLSVTDNLGHTWVKLREQTESNTTALTGVTCALFLAKLTSGLLTTDTISIALAAAATAKGAGLSELAAAAGYDIVLSASGANGSNAAAATTYSVALSGLTNVAGLYVGLAAAEGEALADVTADAAYTALNTGFGSGSVGIGTSNVIATNASLLNTSTGDTYDNTGLNSSDRATILVRLQESAFVPRNPAINHQNPAFL